MYPFDIQKNKPKGFPSIKKEPVFNSKTDLQLEKPKKIKSRLNKEQVACNNDSITCKSHVEFLN